MANHFSARDAKNRFGELLNAAQREPVTIEKHGRPVAVMLSAADYDEIQALKMEALKAKIARGLADIEAGRYVEGDAVFAELREISQRAGKD